MTKKTMATPVNFKLANVLMQGDGDKVSDLPVLRIGQHHVSLWRLSEEELKHINETGHIALDVMVVRGFPPVYVGSIDTLGKVIFGDGFQGPSIHTEDVASMPPEGVLQTDTVPPSQAYQPPIKVWDADAQAGGNEDRDTILEAASRGAEPSGD